VHQNVPEAFLVGRGLTNYWGYNTIGYFAPHNAYSAAVRASPAARSPSSRRWWTRCTGPAWK
jgi:pullulanase/glycogen debranching enzyme